MKKLFIFVSAMTIALSGIAQNKGNGKGHNKQKHADKVKHKSSDRNDDRYDDDRYNKRNTGKYTNSLPSKVRAAFNRDYPNATNITWTKQNGNWTARFGNGIFSNTATYHANGNRIDANTSRRRTQDQSQSNDGSIWDRILTRQ